MNDRLPTQDELDERTEREARANIHRECDELADARDTRIEQLLGEAMDWSDRASALEAMLRKHQWCAKVPDEEFTGAIDCCPECNAQVYWTQFRKEPFVQHGEHRSDCALMALLERT